MQFHQTSMDRLISNFKSLKMQVPPLPTKIGILRVLYIHIESAKHDGHGYGGILKELENNGFDKTTLNHFYGLMNRIRLENGIPKFAPKDMVADSDAKSTIFKSSVYSATDTNDQINSKVQTALMPSKLQDIKKFANSFDIDPSKFD